MSENFLYFLTLCSRDESLLGFKFLILIILNVYNKIIKSLARYSFLKLFLSMMSVCVCVPAPEDILVIGSCMNEL